MLRVLFETFVENSDPWGSGLTPNPENHSIWVWGPDICGLKKKKNTVFLFIFFENVKNNPCRKWLYFLYFVVLISSEL